MLPIVKCKPLTVYLRIEMSWTQVEILLLGVYGISCLQAKPYNQTRIKPTPELSHSQNQTSNHNPKL